MPETLLVRAQRLPWINGVMQVTFQIPMNVRTDPKIPVVIHALPHESQSDITVAIT